MKTIKLLALTGCLTCIPLGAVQAAPVQWVGNGHFYEFIASGANWQTSLANAAAATPLAGYESYLVTITSADESAFIFNTIKNGGFWTSGTDQTTEGTFVWAAGPEAGQVFFGPGAGGAFSKFGSGEPNNNPCCDPTGEDYVHTFSGSEFWNDLAPNNGGFTTGYVVEYSLAPNAVPEPASWALMIAGFGLAGVALRARARASAYAI